MKKNPEELYREWIKEEEQAQIQGWDFAHIEGRYEEEQDMPWDFKGIIQTYLKEDMQLIDMETGGGEFLLSLNHPVQNTAAIEGYPPNVSYCREKLVPLGICFKEADGEGVLPFEDHHFDIVTNRHGSYNVAELKRVLKPGGYFVTQQVGAENDLKLIQMLLPDNNKLPFPEQYLAIRTRELMDHGFEIIESNEAYLPIKFYDVGALVWFAKIIEWEFEGFSVDKCLEQLYHVQEIIEEKGWVEGEIHRFYLVARKK